MPKPYRKLSNEEIRVLESRDCSCPDWNRVWVFEDFEPGQLKNVRFSGDIRLGSLTGTVDLPGGLSLPCGIENAVIHNCSFGHHVLVRNIRSYMANYDIGDGVILDDLRLLCVDGPASFGNGVRVKVINEAGGREIPIFDYLSSHVAYILALYRHDVPLLEKIEALIEAYVKAQTCSRGRIGNHTRITNSGIILNVKIGEAAKIEACSRLENGTVLSKKEAPAYVGCNVIARDFIFSTDSKVDSGCVIRKCFVGQATELAYQYSAEDSVFFANCGGYHGEASSVFAGPYTVTHHKSTLLIAGLFSFLNAGSGSNQSNHMYKLGPVHQGIVERGSKTSSDSYMMWPMRVGAYTLISGRHQGNSDTMDLPFSYLVEEAGESVLVPGVNLRSAGTIRDADKWPARDQRNDPMVNDFLTFNLLTPYTCERMARGIKILEEIQDAAGLSSQSFYYNGVKIQRHALEKGIKYYQLGIRRYTGNVVMSLLRAAPVKDFEEARSRFAPKHRDDGEWLDLAGLYVPNQEVEAFFRDIRRGRVKTLESLQDRFRRFHGSFDDYELSWVNSFMKKEKGKILPDFSPEELCLLIQDWIEAVEELDLLRLEDCYKEYTQVSRIGFGVDGGAPVRDKDFAAVRGDAAGHPLVKEITVKLALKKESARKMILRLSRL